MSAPNPFDAPPDAGEEATHLVLHNGVGYALWPAFAAPPAGWSTAHGPDTHAACLEFVENR